VTLLAGSWSVARAAGGGHSEQAPHWVVGEVLDVDRIQNRLVLTDGTEVWATDLRQLDQLAAGTKIKIRIEMVGGRRTIYSIERLQQ